MKLRERERESERVVRGAHVDVHAERGDGRKNRARVVWEKTEGIEVRSP